MAARGFVWPFQKQLEPVRSYAGTAAIRACHLAHSRMTLLLRLAAPHASCSGPGAPNARPRKGTVAKPTALFSPFKSRSLTLKNRIVVSPMCVDAASNSYYQGTRVREAISQPCGECNDVLRLIATCRCMYSSQDGFLNDHHLVHLGNLARGTPHLTHESHLLNSHNTLSTTGHGFHVTECGRNRRGGGGDGGGDGRGA